LYTVGRVLKTSLKVETILKLIERSIEVAKKIDKPLLKSRPGLTPASRENQLISLAIDLAEKQLREGTASSQVISHFLKLGSTNNMLEKQILEKQTALLTAKTEAIKSGKVIEELYTNALKAMRSYSGQNNSDI
jgi:hypothetical protein